MFTRKFLGNPFYLCLGVFCLLAIKSAGQCSITNLNASYCSDDAPFFLSSAPGGLNFYRAGVGAVTFYDPSTTIGADTVVATNGVASAYTISTVGSFSPAVPAGSTSVPLFDDSESGPIGLGFTFNFFGVDYTDLYIGTNGLVGFAPGVTTPTHQTLPDVTGPNAVIAAAWSSLNPTPGPIEYFVKGRAPFRRFIINYNVQHDDGATYVIQSQIQLHETTNIIEIHSTDVTLLGLATQGIENETGTLSYSPAGRNNQNWSVTNDYVAFVPTCLDIQYVTVTETPAPAEAGPVTIEQCNNGSFVMSATAASAGTGTWSVVAGSATITDVNNPTTTITAVAAGTSATLRWTVTNGSCSGGFDEVELVNYSNPSTADAGIAQSNCNSGSFTLAASAPTNGTGLWTIVSGTGVITSPTSPITTVTGVPAGTALTLQWEVSNGTCASSTDQVVLTNFAPPSVSDAGPAAIPQCNTSSFVMSANAPAVGTGAWSLISGSATIVTPASPNTTITGVAAGTSATLRWTITNGTCPASIDDVVLINNAAPTTADAGPPSISQCTNSTFFVSGNVPVIGSGNWTVVSGTASLGTPSFPTTSVSGVDPGETVVLRWSITNGTCPASTDDIQLINNDSPSTADAGSDLQNCNDQNFTLAATAPATGTGAWSVVSGTATVTTPSDPTSTVTNVPVGTTAVLRWTVSNGTCPVSTDDVSLINYQLPSVANAGPATITQCNNGTFFMGANTPAIGSGTWSVVSGSATITNPTSPTTTITGIAAGASAQLQWAVTNGTCPPTTDVITLTNLPLPSLAIAGPNLVNCNSGDFTMAAVAPFSGTGSWTLISGTATITTPSSATTTVTGVPPGTSALLRWTVTSGSCPTNTDDITLTNAALPTVADAGPPSIEQCNTSTFAVTANSPAVGTGTWSVVSGSATITNPASFNTSVTGVAAGATVTLRWTISNATCPVSTDDIDLINTQPPSSADAGSDEVNCNDGNFSMAATPPVIGTGSWSLINGTATITTPSDPNSTVTGIPVGTSATLRWTVTSGSCAVTTDDVVLTNAASPTVADAGPPSIEQCNTSTFAVTANSPVVGTGMWSVVSGSATITNPASFNTSVTGVAAGATVTLRWTISNATCPVSTDDIDLINTQPPSSADAGSDEVNCNDGNFSMAATPPVIGTGSWSLISGTATITTPSDPNSTVTGIPVGTSATLRWTVTSGSCAANTDDVVLTNAASPTVADAGDPSTEQCDTGTFSLTANLPATGVGQWSVVSGTATITNPTSFTTTVTGVPVGTSATLRWTITNATCPASSDDIILTNTAPPSNAFAGFGQQNCNDGNFTLAANTPAIGIGTWTVISGVANITSPNSPNSTVTGVPVGTEVLLRWTITNGVCPAKFSQVFLTNDEPPTPADAGPLLIEQCNNSTFSMSANTALVGFGTWSVVSGTATITNINSPTTTITNVTAGSTVVLRWTINNLSCGGVSDDITLVNNVLPSTAVAGDDQVQCNDGNFTLGATSPADGTGSWSLVSGTATITTPADPSTTVTGVPVGTDAVLRWTVSLGSCPVNTDDVTVTNANLPTTADAGPPSIEQCNSGNFAITGNVPVIGTGLWSVVSGTATIVNPASFNTSVTGVAAGSSVTLRWTISNATCPVSADDVILTHTVPPSASDAGADQQQCNTPDFTLAAQAPAVGTGNWSLVSGIATIDDPASPTSAVSGVPVGTAAVLRWTVSSGVCPVTIDDVILTNDQLPTTADAGAPTIEQCNNSTFTMAANAAVSGTGSWSIVSGSATIINTNSPTTTVTNVIAGTTVVLRWTITNASCGSTTDDVSLINYEIPTTAAAGVDIPQCDVPDFTMAANVPTIGTGAWSLISGTATIVDPTSPVTQITGVPPGTSATLRWSITNGTCSPSTDDVTIINYSSPLVADAGPPQIEQCNNSTFSMNANSPGVGSGTWTIVSGVATITNVSSPTTTITGVLAGTTVTARWTITNGVCPGTSDDIQLINNNQVTASNAGPNQELCGPTTVLAANAPAIGTGLWSIVSGAGGSVDVPTNPAATFTGVPGTTYTLQWVITNGNCESTDEVDIVLKRIPDVAASDIGICNGESTNIALSNPNGVPGVAFNWIVVGPVNITGAAGGTGNVINQVLTVTDGVSSGSLIYRVTPTANGCDGTPLDIAVNVSPKPVITTPPADFIVNICSGISLNLLPTSTVVGTNYSWTSNVLGTLSGVSAGGTGAITDTPVNNTNAPAVIIYSVTPSFGSCIGTPVNYVVTVNPLPDVDAVDAMICSGESTNVSISNPNNVFGTTFSWTVQSATNVTGSSDGTGTVISQLLTATDGVTDGTVVYRITPSANNCDGAFLDVTVTVKAVPVFTNDAIELSQQICGGESLNFIPTTTIPAATYSWTSSTTGPIDPGSVTGSGSTPITDTPVNTGVVSGTITYHIIPSLNGCDGPAIDLVVLVRPLPSATASDIVICSGDIATIVLTPGPQNIPGTTFTWTATPSANVTGATDGNGSTISQQLATTDANVGTVVYTVIPSVNGCDGPSINVTVTVNPIATVSAGGDYMVCEPVSIPISGLLGGSATSGSWSIVAGAGVLSPSVVTGSDVTADYTVDPSDIGGSVTFRLTVDDPDGPGGPCTIVFDEVTIAVNRQARVTAPADYSVCEPVAIPLLGVLSGSALSGSWTVISGNGTLSVSSVTGSDVSANYIVDPADIGTTLTFRITTNDPDGAGPCIPEFDEVNIVVNESAKADAGPDEAVCEDQTVQLNGSISGTAASVTWSGGSGAAQFSDVNLLNPTYTLTAADIAAGSITLTMTTNDPDGAGPCTSVSDMVVISINQLPVVFLSGLDPSYAENDPPVSMDGFPLGGTFTGPGVLAGSSIFDPANANIGINIITYTYTDPNGCTNSTSRSVVVNELTTIDFGVYNGTNYDFSPAPEICGNIGRAYLRGIPDYASGQTPTFFSSPDIQPRIGLDATGYYIDTDGIPAGQYYIQYTYTNDLFATSVLIKRVTIYAPPVAVIDVTNACENEQVQFNDQSFVPPNALGGNVNAWLWDFDDQGLLNPAQNPTYTYIDPGVYDVELTVTTDQGCSHSVVKPITIGPPPNVDFTWSGICNTQSTQFTDLSTIPGNFSTIENYQWDFGDGDVTLLDLGANPIPPGTHSDRTTGTYQSPGHRFATFNEFFVTLTVETDVGCVRQATKRVYILDYPTATPTSGYFENFEGGSGTWFKTSTDSTSWLWGSPFGGTINSAASGINAWWTGTNVDSATTKSTYLDSENSEVIGPCLDLTGLQRPMISLNYYSDSQVGFDGAVVQYSVDGGASWVVIGDASGEGIDWYNSTDLSGNPGGQDNFAWSYDTMSTWRNARFSLSEIPPAERDQVIFRIAFGSNDGNLQSGRILNGFGFDDVYIGEKHRNVLVEHFTNVGNSPGFETAENNLNVLDDGSSDFMKLEYHLGSPSLDSLNLGNPAVPSARALFYNVASAPTTVMDGIVGDYFGTVFNGTSSQVNLTEINRRSLEDPAFSIELDTFSTTDNKIKGEIRVTYTDSTRSYDDAVLLQIAFVDSISSFNSSRTFRNVVRKFLLNNGGRLVSQQWTYGSTYTFAFESLIDVPINESSRHYLVAFVQDKPSGRMHQSVRKPMGAKKGVRPVGLEDDPIAAEVRDILIYPNPASNTLYLNIQNQVTKDYSWKLVDQRGITVLDGMVNRFFDEPQRIDISQVANGIYFLQIGIGNLTLMHRKIAVMNRN